MYLKLKVKNLYWNRLEFQRSIGMWTNIVVQLLSHVQVFVTRGLQHTRLLCPPLSPRICSNSCPFSGWCRPTISSSVTPFSFCPQSFPASGCFPMSQLFKAGGQSIGASASVLPKNIQGWFPLRLTGLISLQSKVWTPYSLPKSWVDVCYFCSFNFKTNCFRNKSCVLL